MFKTDVININGNKQRCVNLFYPVGVGAKNYKSDVQLIQALFLYLYLDKDAKLIGSPLITPGQAFIEKLVPTGFLDAITIQAIAYFQVMNRRHLLSTDAVIHPAKYEGRVIKDTNKPLMTITYLHLLARRAELRSGKGDYIETIRIIATHFHAMEIAGAMARKSIPWKR